jgi:hypothetical protein
VLQERPQAGVVPVHVGCPFAPELGPGQTVEHAPQWLTSVAA